MIYKGLIFLIAAPLLITIGCEGTRASLGDGRGDGTETDDGSNDSDGIEEYNTAKFEDGKCYTVIPAIIRDFSVGHPDFESYSGNPTPTLGLVQDTLGDDQKPMWQSNGPFKPQMSGPDNFYQWYNDDPDINWTKTIALNLVEDLTRPGVLVYSNNNFFPLAADEGWGAEMPDFPNVNYHFTTEVHMTFKYQAGQTFMFKGDDDLWVFIDGKLAMDLGGLHQEIAQTIDIDEFAAEQGLVPGQQYSMDMFHAERHTEASNFHVETTIGCFIPII